MFSFFANQSNSPQLDDEDLEQIDHDDLEEMDLKWQMAMLSMRVKQFYKKTGRKLIFNGKEPVGQCFDCQDGLGLESVEAQLVIHQKNEVVYEEKIAVLEFKVKDKINAITKLKNQLDETLREKDDLKAKLEQFETSSKNLNKLINSQLSSKDKTGLGYGDQLNENDSSGSELFNSVFDSRSSDGDDNQTNDRFKKDNGYHVVPPPLTGNYMPPLADLSFAGLDDSVYRPTANKTSASVSQVEASTSQTSNTSVEMPRVESVRPSGVIIEDWVSDDEDIFQSNDLQATDKPNRRDWNGKMTQKLGLGFGFTKKACFVCGSYSHLIKDCDFHEKRMAKKSVLKNIGKNTSQREIRPVWNSAQRINHQNKFVPSAVLTRFGRVPVSAAKQSSLRATTSTSTFRPVNTATHTNRVNVSKLRTNAFHKSHSPIRRSFYKSTAPNTRISNEKVNIVRVNGVNTVGQTAVSVVKGNGVTVVKASAGNKDFITDYQDIDGGFVAFGRSARGGKITRKGKIRTYKLDFEDVFFVKELKFNLFAKATIDESKLWHRRLGHVNFKTMNKLVKGNLVRGLPLKIFDNDHTCVACQKGKQHKASLTDDFSRFSWVFFLASKDETSRILKRFITEIENQLNHKVKVIMCDNGTEFKNREMNEFCGLKGIKKEFSVSRTLKQNGVTERKNRTLIEAARTMLVDLLLPAVFWAEAVNTACYVLNRVLVTKPHNKTPYELIIGRPLRISFMRPFGCPVTILNTLDPLGKFDGKVEEEFLVGYSVNSKAFRVFNSQTRKVEENLHVNFLENKPNVPGQRPNWLFDIDPLTNSMNYQPVTAGNQTNKNACPQEANGNTGLKKSVDARQFEENNVSTQQYIVFPLWSFISSCYKSSVEKYKNDTADDTAGETPVQKPASKNEQALENVLDKMIDQEKEAAEQSDVVRQEFEAQCNKELLQGKATRASSTNSFNTVSTPVNAANAPRTSNDVGPSFVPLGRSFPFDVNDFPDDPLMPDLEDTAEV
ncbi:putative ribonuclease H-like domain-containing protein [Tanacetum coccineum]